MEKSIELTPLDIRLFDIIKQYIDENNYSPTVRELAGLLNVKSTSTVQDHLDVLEKKGYIKRNKSMSRTIRILQC